MPWRLPKLIKPDLAMIESKCHRDVAEMIANQAQIDDVTAKIQYLLDRSHSASPSAKSETVPLVKYGGSQDMTIGKARQYYQDVILPELAAEQARLVRQYDRHCVPRNKLIQQQSTLTTITAPLSPSIST